MPIKLIFVIIYFLINFSNVHANEKIYFLDIDFILNNSKEGKTIIAKLTDINSQNIKELKIFENKLKSQENEISKVKNIISEKELNTKIDNLKKEINLYKLEKNKKVEEFKIFKDNELKIFFEKLSPLIEEFMKKNSIAIVLDKKNIFIADSKYDISKDIIEFLDQLN
jgi:outer membrane protein